MSDPRQSPGYVDEKLLRILGQKIEPIKKRSYELLRVKPGELVLDAGCGPGLDTTTLANQLGKEVRIIGVDYDPEMIAAANKRATSLGLGNQVEHRVGDITALEFADSTFDAVRCDRVLQHVSRGEIAIHELVRVAKPGGRLVLFDPDWSTFSTDFPNRDLEWRIRRVATEWFANGYAARQSWRILIQCGVDQVRAEPLSVVFSYPEMRYLLLMDKVEQAALQAGVITTKELEYWRTMNEEADKTGTFLSTVTGILVSGTKRALQPGEGSDGKQKGSKA